MALLNNSNSTAHKQLTFFSAAPPAFTFPATQTKAFAGLHTHGEQTTRPKVCSSNAPRRKNFDGKVRKSAGPGVRVPEHEAVCVTIAKRGMRRARLLLGHLLDQRDMCPRRCPVLVGAGREDMRVPTMAQPHTWACSRSHKRFSPSQPGTAAIPPEETCRPGGAAAARSPQPR